MFRRILIANRGEVVARVLRTCARLGVEAVTVCSEADRDAPYHRDATATVCLGPAPSSQSYLDRVGLIQAARQTGCAAIHPGWGFLSEDPLFAEMCRQHGLAFVGPPAGATRLMGRKLDAKAAARAAGLPVIPGSLGALRSLEEARAVAGEVGFPVILKADAGGGGKGMRLCRDAAELAEGWSLARAEAAAAFGDDALYLERYVEGGRHVELQLLVDGWGNAVHLGERECSVQRKHQKLLEESPSVALASDVREATGRAAAAAAARVGYVGAGTMEFLLGTDGVLRFMEMNARLQVEHPVTEERTGLDLVELQLRIAAGEPLPFRQEEVRLEGHAIEVRLNAEDPHQAFRPAPGTITRLRWPEGVRVESHVREGYKVPPHYDSLLAKLIARAPDRASCIARMVRALEELVLEGVPTTRPLLLAVLGSEPFRRGEYDIRSIPGWPPDGARS